MFILLALNLVAFACALYITWKAFQDSVMWGLFFLLTPGVYIVLSGFTGSVIAGVIVIGLQLYYVVTNWRTVGKVFVVMVIVWLAAQFLPRLLSPPEEVGDQAVPAGHALARRGAGADAIAG